jgi:NADP-dependent 3-hydroxy acid dehydrogenase YdfG
MTILSGKTALVTSASRGIGRATALALARGGAQVLVHYGRGATEAEAVVREIRDAGGRADMVSADMAAADGPHKLAADVRRIIGDRLDILVANAGIANDATIEAMTVTNFDALFAVNVRAPFFLVQQLLPVLGKGSSVVLLSSLAAHASVGTLSAYAATKGAIETLVKHFASYSVSAASALTLSRRAWSKPTCRASPARMRAAISRWACKRCSASPNRTTSVMRSLSSPRTRPAGSPATRCGSMAARSSDHPHEHDRERGRWP